MSEPKHTPGPWKTKGPDFVGDCNIVTDDGYLIVACATANGGCGGERAITNALLIAAAPELLEACEKAVYDAAGLSVSHPHLRPDWLDIMALAIAKAKGENYSCPSAECIKELRK